MSARGFGKRRVEGQKERAGARAENIQRHLRASVTIPRCRRRCREHPDTFEDFQSEGRLPRDRKWDDSQLPVIGVPRSEPLAPQARARPPENRKRGKLMNCSKNTRATKFQGPEMGWLDSACSFATSALQPESNHHGKEAGRSQQGTPNGWRQEREHRSRLEERHRYEVDGEVEARGVKSRVTLPLPGDQ